MSTLEALTSGAVILAMAAYGGVSLLVEGVGRWLLNTVSSVEPSHWLFEHALIPAARALALVVFILLAYPALFGLTEAPPLDALLAAGRGRTMALVNLTCLLSLLLPLLPVLGRLPALVLPIQAIAAASLLFHWWAVSLGRQDIHYWPGWATVGGLLVLAFASHTLVSKLAPLIAHGLPGEVEKVELERLLYRSGILILQAPVILVYTLSLGRQLY